MFNIIIRIFLRFGQGEVRNHILLSSPKNYSIINRQGGKIMKLNHLKKIFKYTSAFGLCSLLFSGVLMASDVPEKTFEEPIAPGVLHQSYEWMTNYGNIHFDILQCDLNNPNLDLKLVAGAGEYTKRATVSAMANRTNAVALLNGDFFNMSLQGAPIGPSIVNNRLQSSPAKIAGIFSLGIDQNNTAYIEPFSYRGSLTAEDGVSYPIDGLNKTYYWHDPSGQESHTDTIQLYNDFWGSSSRGHATNTEVLVNAQGVVENISQNSTLPYEVPDSKYILQVNGKAENFIKEHCPIGSKVIIQSDISPNKNWKFLVGGHGLLTENGHMVPYTKDLNALAGVRARSAAAISQDGKTLWFICAEGRTARSAGIHLSSLGYFIESIGGYKSVNLDGGGSTTMVLKHLGDFNRSTVVAPEGYGRQRSVVNGIGIYNSMPESTIAGYRLSGPDEMVIGETGLFYIQKAWDTNLHPKQPTDTSYTWSIDHPTYGAWAGQYFLALKPGDISVRSASAEGIAEEKKVHIHGSEFISSLSLKTERFIVGENSSFNSTLFATLKDGREVMLSPKVATWSIEGFTGNVNEGYSTIASCNNLANGKIIAEVGDLKAEALLGNEAFNLLDLYINQSTYWLNGKKYMTDQPPIIINSRTMIPLRLLAESLGGEVSWNSDDRIAEVQYQNNHLRLPIDKAEIVVNNQKNIIDTPAQIINNRTMVPIRFISEALGMNIEYNATNNVVSVTAQK